VRPRRFGPATTPLVGSVEPSAAPHFTAPGAGYGVGWASSLPSSGATHPGSNVMAGAAYPTRVSGLAPVAPAALGPAIPLNAADCSTAHAAGTIAAFRAQAQALLAARGLAPPPGVSRSHYVPGMRY
jgi:hypothetical protein